MSFARVRNGKLPPTRASPTSRNLALRASVGLRQLSIRIAANHVHDKHRQDSRHRLDEQDAWTDADGRLVLRNNSGAAQRVVVMAYRFEVAGGLGEGAFSQTLKAVDTYDPGRRLVAIKVMHAHFSPLGDEECLRLRALPDTHHIVKLITSFHYGKHACLVFELLQPKPLLALNLPTPIHDPRHITRIKLNAVRKLSCQLLTALMLLRKHNIIHADLKPDNILFRNDASHHLKLIDFGNAFSMKEAPSYYGNFDIQSFLYRAPEVLIGLPIDFSIDMWSVGVIICEAWLGRPMFQGDDAVSLVTNMMSVLGPLPKEPFQRGKFYHPDLSDPNFATADTFSLDLNNDSERFKFRIRRLSECLDTRDIHFLHFLNALLEYDPSKRIRPAEAICHPFLAELFPFAQFDACLRQEKESIGNEFADTTMDVAMESTMKHNDIDLTCINGDNQNQDDVESNNAHKPPKDKPKIHIPANDNQKICISTNDNQTIQIELSKSGAPTQAMLPENDACSKVDVKKEHLALQRPLANVLQKMSSSSPTPQFHRHGPLPLKRSAVDSILQKTKSPRMLAQPSPCATIERKLPHATPVDQHSHKNESREASGKGTTSSLTVKKDPNEDLYGSKELNAGDSKALVYSNGSERKGEPVPNGQRPNTSSRRETRLRASSSPVRGNINKSVECESSFLDKKKEPTRRMSRELNNLRSHFEAKKRAKHPKHQPAASSPLVRPTE